MRGKQSPGDAGAFGSREGRDEMIDEASRKMPEAIVARGNAARIGP
jgi:hypothetical protein